MQHTWQNSTRYERSPLHVVLIYCEQPRVSFMLQVEGVIADYGIGLSDLIGVITEFFSRVGTLPC